MPPKYCPNCGSKATSLIAKFCASCGNSLDGSISPSKTSNAQDDPEGSNVVEVPKISDLIVDFGEGVEFEKYSQAKSFSFDGFGNVIQRPIQTRRS